MVSKTPLKILFTLILLTMVAYSTYATLHQSLFEWTGLTAGADRYWTTATLLDAYFGFVTFCVWLFYKERRWLTRVPWFVAIMLFGNIAMAGYVLLQLARLRPEEPASAILTARNG